MLFGLYGGCTNRVCVMPCAVVPSSLSHDIKLVQSNLAWFPAMTAAAESATTIRALGLSTMSSLGRCYHPPHARPSLAPRYLFQLCLTPLIIQTLGCSSSSSLAVRLVTVKLASGDATPVPACSVRVGALVLCPSIDPHHEVSREGRYCRLSGLSKSIR